MLSSSIGHKKKTEKVFRPNNPFVYWTIYVTMLVLGGFATYNTAKIAIFTVATSQEVTTTWNQSVTQETVGAFKHSNRVMQYSSTDLEVIYNYEYQGQRYYNEHALPAYESIRMNVMAGAVHSKSSIRVSILVPSFSILTREFFLLIEKTGIEIVAILLLAMLRFWVGRTGLRIS